MLNFLKSDSTKIKTAALIGLFNLDKSTAQEISYQIIEKENPTRIKKVAEFIFSKQGIDHHRLRKIYELTDLSSKKIILRLINNFGGWSAAGDYLKALTENNENLNLYANSLLETWIKYTTRLATTQTDEDKEYVLKWYKKAETMGIYVPKEIPFIFRNIEI
jgi:hypothetical protein